MSNLTGLFDNVNENVSGISGQIGQTPQNWNSDIFNMIETLSETVILPIAGVILAIGRIVGETAALIYTAGTYAQTADSLFSPVRTLSVHMYVLSSEGLHIDQAYATAAVLLIVVVGINALSAAVAKSIVKRRG